MKKVPVKFCETAASSGRRRVRIIRWGFRAREDDNDDDDDARGVSFMCQQHRERLSAHLTHSSGL